MATADPLDDLLNAVVDGQEISAIVGTLESQLASPTNQEPQNQSSTTSVNSNHVGEGRVGERASVHSGADGTQTGQKPGLIDNNSQISVNAANGSKNSISQAQILGLNSVVTSASHVLNSASAGSGPPNVKHTVGHNGNVVSSLKLNTVSNATIKSEPDSQLHANNLPKPVIVSIGSTNTGTVVVSQNCVIGQPGVTGTTSSGGSAIYNLASVAAEQAPLSIPQNSQVRPPLVVQQARTVREQLKDKNSGTGLNKAQFVVKQEPQFVVKQELNKSPQVRPVVTHAQGQVVTVSSSVPQTHNVITSSVGKSSTPPASNVIISNTVTSGTNAQTLQGAVVRPQVSQNIQVISVNPGQPRMAGGTPQQRTIAPRVITSAPIRIAAAPNQQMVAPRAAGPTITLPAGLHLPPGTMLMKNEQGQLVFVSQQGAPIPAQAVHGQPGTVKVQAVRNPGPGIATSLPQGMVTLSSSQTSHQTSNITVRPPSSTVTHTVRPPGQPLVHAQPQHIVRQVQQPGASASHSPSVGPAAAQSSANNNSLIENVKKCKNFLSTLIKLASNQPADTVKNVKNLIQGLIDGRIDPEHFTNQLQVELKSSPQPYLVPFLKRSLPLLRQSLSRNEMTIEGVRAPPPSALALQPGQTLPSVMAGQRQTLQGIRTAQPGVKNIQQVRHLTPQQMVMYQHQQTRLQGQPIKLQQGPPAKMIARPGMPGQMVIQGQMKPAMVPVQAHKEKRKYDSLNDDADINDVATMGGVNLSEESRNILATNSELMLGQMRSCKDESFLIHSPLVRRINHIAKKHGLEEVPTEVANLISHATQERLRTVAEKLSIIAEHRLEIYKGDSLFENTTEVRSQLKFIEELDKLEKKRHEEAEREILLRAAKSRSKHEDPEQLKLKEKAKALQQAEMEELRHQEANKTALMAIGSRKKKKLEDSQAGNNASSSSNGSSSNTRTSVLRQRIKRVTLRDVIFYLEQERETRRSSLLYKGYLK